MLTRYPQATALLALALFSSFAQADNDAPARAGRISVVQGNVSVSADPGYQAEAALLNLPVTSHNQFTTARDARTEFHVGSTAVRLDGDSSLEVSQLDDERLVLRLNYGSASIRIRNADNVRGFELDTPQGRVRLQEPGRVRVDADRMPDTSTISMFDGTAIVDAGGSSVTVRAGKRVEIHNDDVHTGLAARDSFDEWATQRDQYDQRATSARYVPQEMTGYEELEQNGYWRESAEYGAIWMPRSVPVDWAPYRDGRWTWVSPWGWTWVDNAPWGYAPFHYGRWIVIDRRWCWAPGRYVGRPVWAPALVGWVGGNNWQVSFTSGGTSRHAPAQGWYPLRPHEAYVPTYRVSNEHLRQINLHAREERQHEREHDFRRDGLTVVPHEQFTHRGLVDVHNAPRPAAGPLVLQSVQPLAPPTPQGPLAGRGNEPRRDERRDERFHGGRPDRQPVQPAAPVATAPIAAAAAPVVSAPPSLRPPAEETYRQRRPEPASATSISTPVQARAIPDEPRQPRRVPQEAVAAPAAAAAAPRSAQPPAPVTQAPMPVHEAARPVPPPPPASHPPMPVHEAARPAPREAAAPAPPARSSANTEAQKEPRGRKDERKEDQH